MMSFMLFEILPPPLLLGAPDDYPTPVMFARMSPKRIAPAVHVDSIAKGECLPRL